MNPGSLSVLRGTSWNLVRTCVGGKCNELRFIKFRKTNHGLVRSSCLEGGTKSWMILPYPVSIFPHRPNAIYILLIIIPGQLRLYHFFCFLAPCRQLKIKWFPFHWSCWRLTGLVILKVRSLEMLSPRLLLVRFSLSGFYVMSIVSKPLWADVKRKNKKFF